MNHLLHEGRTVILALLSGAVGIAILWIGGVAVSAAVLARSSDVA
jgi:hypothetical protein